MAGDCSTLLPFMSALAVSIAELRNNDTEAMAIASLLARIGRPVVPTADMATVINALRVLVVRRQNSQMQKLFRNCPLPEAGAKELFSFGEALIQKISASASRWVAGPTVAAASEGRGAVSILAMGRERVRRGCADCRFPTRSA